MCECACVRTERARDERVWVRIMCVHVRACARVCLRACVSVCVRACVSVCVRACVSVCVCIYEREKTN